MGEHDLMTELASWRGTASCQESALDAGLCMIRYAFVLASPKCVPPCIEAGVALIGPGFMLSCFGGMWLVWFSNREQPLLSMSW